MTTSKGIWTTCLEFLPCASILHSTSLCRLQTVMVVLITSTLLFIIFKSGIVGEINPSEQLAYYFTPREDSLAEVQPQNKTGELEDSSGKVHEQIQSEPMTPMHETAGTVSPKNHTENLRDKKQEIPKIHPEHSRHKKPENPVISTSSVESTEPARKEHHETPAKGHETPAVFKGHRIVHLDLKGAPPLVSYYKKIFPLIKELGGTGLLIEYEDMFPYRHEALTAKNAYSKADIAEIQRLAAANQLIVIPLIQTFGHMEFVMKRKEYKHLREMPRYLQAICPSREGSTTLLQEMIDDMLALHPESQFIHIGCDEVYYLGRCGQCQQRMQQMSWSSSDLYLDHLSTVARYIKSKKPSMTVLAWDDMMRKMPLSELLKSKVGDFVEPVVWSYHGVSNGAIQSSYNQVFRGIWIASAFKGAQSPDTMLTDIDARWHNHDSWVKAVRSEPKVRGILMTGWQRFDHFAPLCELFPVAFPSLAVSLAYLSSQSGESWPNAKARGVLKCSGVKGLRRLGYPVHCSFPGSGVFSGIQAFYSLQIRLQEMTKQSYFRAGFTDYNIKMNFGSPSNVENAVESLDGIRSEMARITRTLQEAMLEMYDASVWEEVQDTLLRPFQREVDRLWEGKQRLLARDDWPRRPLTATNSSGAFD